MFWTFSTVRGRNVEITGSLNHQWNDEYYRGSNLQATNDRFLSSFVSLLPLSWTLLSRLNAFSRESADSATGDDLRTRPFENRLERKSGRPLCLSLVRDPIEEERRPTTFFKTFLQPRVKVSPDKNHRSYQVRGNVEVHAAFSLFFFFSFFLRSRCFEARRRRRKRRGNHHDHVQV